MNDIAEKNNLAVIPTNDLLLKAIESGTSVESLEKLLALQEKVQADISKRAYYEALAKFQSKCPIIGKNKEVKGKNGEVRYRYATLDGIVEQIKDTLQECGLSYTIKTETREKMITATCIIHHIGGHSESSHFSIPVDEEAYMNDAQKQGSALTYAKRYAFSNALGIMTTDIDDDGQSLGKGIDVNEVYRRATLHMSKVFENLDTILAMKEFLAGDMLDEAAEAWTEIVDKNTLSALTLAPTKGGCFTVEEKEKMNSDEFKKLVRTYRKDRPLEGL